MTAAYPSTVKSFTTKVDFTDTVLAEHVNTLQEEVNALQANLGTFIKTGSGWVGSFDQVTTSWDTLKDRIANIEYGLGTVYGDRVSTGGGSTIQPATDIVNLTIKAKSSQTASLVEFQTSAGTIISKVDAAGEIYTSGKKVVPIVYSATQPSSVPAGTIWVDSSSDIAQLTAQSGITTGGTTGQALVKDSNDDYDVTWATFHSTPAGGDEGQYLVKSSNNDYETTWITLPDPLDPFLLGGM